MREAAIEKALREIEEFVYTLKDNGVNFKGLKVLRGGEESLDTMGESIASCVYQDRRAPIIFLADSNILSTYRLTKAEIDAILYHEKAHYALGHLDSIEGPVPHDLESYIKEESTTDLKGVELAVKCGIDKDKIAFDLAVALYKIQVKMVADLIYAKSDISKDGMEALDTRIHILSKLFSNSKYEKKMMCIYKSSMKKLIKSVSKAYGTTDKAEIIEILDQADM